MFRRRSAGREMPLRRRGGRLQDAKPFLFFEVSKLAGDYDMI